MYKLHLNLSDSGKQNWTKGRKRFYLIPGTMLVIIGLLGIITGINYSFNLPTVISYFCLTSLGSINIMMAKGYDLKLANAFFYIDSEKIQYRFSFFSQTKEFNLDTIREVRFYNSRLSIKQKNKKISQIKLTWISYKHVSLIKKTIVQICRQKGIKMITVS